MKRPTKHSFREVLAMRINVITSAIVVSIMCTTGSHRCYAQSVGTADEKPVVTLIVKFTRLTINRGDGTISFQVDAAANEGFQGTVSGTLSVAQPTNPSGVQLTEGRDSKTFPFTLKAGQKTSETTPPRLAPSQRTSPANDHSGTLTYIVGVDPSAKYTVKGWPEEVKVITSP